MKNDKWLDLTNGVCWSIIFSLAAIIMSIVAMAHKCPRIYGKEHLGFDYIGVIVGILALLVTLLVAWNIWQTMVSRDEVRKVTKALYKIKGLETQINNQRSLFESRNLEVKYLIDAHARLHEADKVDALSSKYIAYADAIKLLLMSNVDLAYEQFERAKFGLMSVVNQFELNTDPIEADSFISREKEYEWYYQQLISELEKREAKIDDFKEALTSLRDNRRAAIRYMKESGMGKRIERNKQKLRELEKRLREKEAARKAAEAKGTTPH